MSIRSRRGNYATITAVSLTSLVGFGALAIDVSHVNLVDLQLQNGADAIAHGAVMFLDGTDEGLLTAQDVALQVASANYAGGVTFDLQGSGSGAEGTIAFGVWDEDVGTFTESVDAEAINAVRVETSYPDTSSAMMKTVSNAELKPVARSTAVRTLPGAGETDCYLPFALASCLIEDEHGVTGIQDITLVLNPAGVDNVGYGRKGASPNASFLVDQIGDCEADGSVGIGDTLGLQNGVVTPALVAMADEINAATTTWDSSVWGELPLQDSKSSVTAYGGTLEGVFMVFEDDTYCAGGGGSFNGTATVSGLVWGAVYDVVGKGPASDRNIKVRLDTSRQHEFGTKGGGPDWGVQAVSVNLAE